MLGKRLVAMIRQNGGTEYIQGIWQQCATKRSVRSTVAEYLFLHRLREVRLCGRKHLPGKVGRGRMSRYMVVAVDRSAATFLSMFASIPSEYMLPLSQCHALSNYIHHAEASLSCPVPSRLRKITTPAVLVKIHEDG
jgi:hypothetical protein